jgi:hypothetical protein
MNIHTCTCTYIYILHGISLDPRDGPRGTADIVLIVNSLMVFKGCIVRLYYANAIFQDSNVHNISIVVGNDNQRESGPL